MARASRASKVWACSVFGSSLTDAKPCKSDIDSMLCFAEIPCVSPVKLCDHHMPVLHVCRHLQRAIPQSSKLACTCSACCISHAGLP